MHRGCFVWTPTPHLSGRRTPRSGPARVCVCAPFGRVWRVGLPGAFWCASPSAVVALYALLVCPASSGLGLPRLWLFLVFVCLFFVFIFPCCAPLVSVVPCFLAGGALGLGLLWSSRPPLPPFFWFLFPFFFPFPSPPPSLFFVFFPSCFFFVCCPFFFPFVCLGVPVLRCLGWFVCAALWGVLVCVAVGLLPPRGPFCACVVSLVAPLLFVFPVCCCLSFLWCVLCFAR